jgi:hypothetical protein
MIQITENKKGQEIFYEYRIIEKGNVLYSRNIRYRAVIKNVESKDYFILYDPQMIPDSGVFGFLNFANLRVKLLLAAWSLIFYHNGL